MTTLKFEPEQIEDIITGKRSSTWRLFFEDKNIKLGDKIGFINNSDGHIFGWAEVWQITIKRIKDISVQDQMNYEQFASIEDIIRRFKHYYGDNVNEHTEVMMINFHFEKNDNKNESKFPTEVKLFLDGGSRGNPGPSACGYVFMDLDDNIIRVGGQYLGITTNNQAEYNSLKHGIVNAVHMGCTIVHVYMDSLLVVNQMLGIYKIRNRDLWPIYQDIVEQIKQLKKVTFTHVPREMNKIADSKVNEILDSNHRPKY